MYEKIVQFNEEIIKGQLKELVRGSVEETLNELLEKEAESLTQAARYERSEAQAGSVQPSDGLTVSCRNAKASSFFKIIHPFSNQQQEPIVSDHQHAEQ